MKLEKSTGRAILTVAFILASSLCWPAGNSSAQAPMPGMPGMAPPAASPTPESTASPSPAVKAEAAAAAKQDMSGMLGMPPAGRPAEAAPAKEDKGMGAMPGMESGAPARQEKAMSGMPGMDKAAPARKDSMGAMPGMGGGATAKKGQDMSGMPGMAGASGKKSIGGMPGMPAGGATGPKPLAPARKWVPPPGADRSAELLSKQTLAQQLNGLPPPVEDAKIHSFVLTDLLEYRAYSAGPDTFTWDVVGWVGGDFNRLWIKTEGDLNLSRGHAAQGDLQLLYGRLIAPFWDFQAGVRFNGILGPNRSAGSRTYAVLGFQGMAPGNFNVEPALYISDRGEVSAELTLSVDLYLTQRLVLQPRLEVQASIQGDRKFDSASGVNQTDLGLRLRYEIRREFAPYIGFTWQQKYGATAGIARSAGESVGPVAIAAGLQLWY